MVTLRSAVPHDEALLLAWRNDPATRASSFQQDEVSPETHKLWFTRKMDDPACVILIAEEEGQAVGQVRLDRVQPDVAELHIAVAPEARGRGIARQILTLTALDAELLLGVTQLRARVKGTNEVSLRAFRAAGFREVGDDGDVIDLDRAAGS
jgi:RimJ/RimL family protein N-acetyltransferase